METSKHFTAFVNYDLISKKNAISMRYGISHNNRLIKGLIIFLPIQLV